MTYNKFVTSLMDGKETTIDVCIYCDSNMYRQIGGSYNHCTNQKCYSMNEEKKYQQLINDLEDEANEHENKQSKCIDKIYKIREIMRNKYKNAKKQRIDDGTIKKCNSNCHLFN